jgi:hypothetical protein
LIFGPNPSQWWQPFLSRNRFLFFKNHEFFSNFFRFGFGFRKAKLIFGPNPSQWWQPFLSRNRFLFFKNHEIFKKIFASVLASGKPN